MAWARSVPTAVRLGDGQVLVLGDHGGKYEAVPETSRFVDRWDPVTQRWSETDSLPKARGQFAAVRLQDGRALIAGGTNTDWYSYSSAYVFDPATGRWTKTGVMGTARTSPAAVVLPDGRVLVTGGGYLTGVHEGVGVGGTQLVSVHVPIADTWPGHRARRLPGRGSSAPARCRRWAHAR
jgi:N-acetylneuraminic acid mutarotase